jgi:hypothetical protein
MKRQLIYVLIILICFSIPKVYAQDPYDFSEVNILQTEAQRLIENQQPTAGYALFEQILFLIRVEKGLYSVEQVPYLLEYMAWNKEIGAWEKTLSIGERTSWLLGRNEHQIDNYRRLLLEHIYVPEDDSCLRKDRYGLWIRGARLCNDLRFFMADTYIAATELQQIVVQITNNEMDWESLKYLALATAQMVFGVDGSPIMIEIRDGTLERIDNTVIRERYRPDTWLRIAKDADENIKELVGE